MPTTPGSSPQRYRRPSAFKALRLVYLVLLFLLAISVNPSANAQRRDFPATYRVSGVSQLDNKVQLTLTLTLHNFSGADIQNCAIVLNSIAPQSEPIGTFPLLKLLPAYKDTSVEQTFTLTESEYAQWKLGADPNLKILLPDSDDGTRIETIDAHREIPTADPAK
jgi:hypothetical protein